MAPARPPMISMMDAQPMSWMMFNTAGKLEPRIPKAGRTETMEMIPYCEPIIPPNPIKVLPITWPNMMAQKPAQKPMGARKPPAQISAREIATPAHRRK